jgi:hypothetical protein
MTFTAQDANFLLGRPEFLRLVFDVIQSAGIVSNNEGANGRTVQDQSLEWHAGRRSLGHEILLKVEQGQPDALRSPDGLPIMTLQAVLREAINPKEKTRGNRSRNRDRDDNARYDDLNDAD